MRNELLGIVLETEKLVTVGVDVGGELVLDALPGREVGRVLVPVLPDGAPRLEDGARRGGADLGRRGEAALQEAADHQGVGLRVEGVELGGDVGLRTDVERRRRAAVVGGGGVGVGVGNRVCGAVVSRSVVVLVGGVGRRGGGGRGPEDYDFREGEGRVVVVIWVGNGRL